MPWGNPLKLFLTGGEVPDIVPASDLLADYRYCNVLADRGYDSLQLEEQLKTQGCTVVIPSRKTNKVQRDLDGHLYKERHLVEVFLGQDHAVPSGCNPVRQVGSKHPGLDAHCFLPTMDPIENKP